ncbi:MAG: hypothetical protein HY341_02435 [Candidatus Kerfeldbacteria bacterium]|nr:hypothetical protein [Candidatus Kerfeldbacteria bacterium]
MLDQAIIDQLREQGFVRIDYEGVAMGAPGADFPRQVHFKVNVGIRLEGNAIVLSQGGINMDSFQIFEGSILPEDEEWVREDPLRLYSFLLASMANFLAAGIAPYGLTLDVRPSTPPPPLRLL